MRVALLGDAMLGRGVGDELRLCPPEALWSPQLRELTLGCDLVLCNLECCISERGRCTEAIPGKRFFFRGPPAAVKSLSALGVHAISLANNHALDYGEQAMADTLDLLDRAGIASTGAGFGPEAARRGAIVEAAGARVGLLALTDHPPEYGARPGLWGVSLADLHAGLPTWLVTELKRLRREADAVIAFPHWGPNMGTAPARWQRQRAAELLATGADLVAGHSAHLFHGVERHADGFAAYDLGGAIDDYAVDEALRNDLGLLALWSPDSDPELELVGLRLRYAHTDLATGEDADWIARRLSQACAELGTALRPVAEGRYVIRRPARR